MENHARPLDALNAARRKQVLVQLKNGATMTGKLKAFDIHINTVLDDAQETGKDGEKRTLGTAFLRGDTIVFISPA